MRREGDRAQRALEVYLGMGPGRSLSKLCRVYPDHVPGDTLGLPTAKYWCKHYGWVEKARDYDTDVQQAAHSEVKRQAVEKRVEVIDAVDRLCVELVEILDSVKDSAPIKIQTPQDLRAMASALAEMARVRELLEGRATDRVAHMSDDEIDRTLREAFGDEYEAVLARAETRH